MGLSGVVDEFGRTGYLQSTNFFQQSHPSLTLVEDLKKFITNLGDTAMDTVIIIPPHESEDRYVFFPEPSSFGRFSPSRPPISPASK